jgi:hypothetical protein
VSAAYAAETYTALFALTGGMLSTAVPGFNVADFATPDGDIDETQKPAMQRTVEAGLLNPAKYVRWRTRPGDLLIFSHRVPHYGSACDVPGKVRHMVFALVTKHKAKEQDNYQIYPYVRGAGRGWAPV